MEKPSMYGPAREQKSTLTLRVGRDLRQRLHELAFLQNRSLANLAETVLKQYVERDAIQSRIGLLPCEIDDGK